MQNALCSSAYRGVNTTIIFPARNDSWIVAGASRSYYAELLEAGVTIYEYVGGLLHTKSLTLDGEITLIGSANMDRRSFDLNYENNILVYDATLTADVKDTTAAIHRQRCRYTTRIPYEPTLKMRFMRPQIFRSPCRNTSFPRPSKIRGMPTPSSTTN